MTRSMVSDSEIPMDFWGVCMAAHIKNRIKSSVHERTPYELWMERKSNIKYMKRLLLCCLPANKKGEREESLMQKQIKEYSSAMDIIIHIGFIFRETRPNVLAM